MYRKLVLIDNTEYKIGDTFFLEGNGYKISVISSREGMFAVHAISKNGESAWIEIPTTSVMRVFGKYVPSSGVNL